MATLTMTVQEALSRKKIIESEIQKRMTENNLTYGKGKSTYVSYASEYAKTIKGIERDAAIATMKGAFVSTKQLISNLTQLKVAINYSNATTKITVAGKEYTVADAIARYRSLDSEKGFYMACATQYANAVHAVKETNERVNDPENISRYMANVFGSESNKKSETLYNSVLEDYKKNNIVYLIDPNNLGDELGNWSDELNSFESEIHTALVTSNVKTTITVEFED